MRVLVFGDSITQGFYDPNGGWVQHLAAPFYQKALDDPASDQPAFFNLGISADMSQNVLHRIVQETTARKRSHELIFVIAIGVNDACIENGENRTPPEKYRQNVIAIIESARNFSEKILLIGLTPGNEDKTLPVVWGDFYYKNSEIKKFEDILADISHEQKIAFVPMFDAFRGREKELLPDGLHPNAKGHELIASKVKPELDKLLG